VAGVSIGKSVGRSLMSRIVENYLKDLYIILAKNDIESEIYNNALSIKLVIKKLAKRGSLDETDLKIIDGVCRGFNISDLSSILGLDRKRITNSFKRSCDMIAYLLGGEFTTSGFVEKYLNEG
jgi:hypothetical protein